MGTVMLWWCCGDVMVMSLWCYVNIMQIHDDVMVVSWWCHGDVMVMPWWCHGDIIVMPWYLPIFPVGLAMLQNYILNTIPVSGKILSLCRLFPVTLQQARHYIYSGMCHRWPWERNSRISKYRLPRNSGLLQLNWQRQDCLKHRKNLSIQL